MKIFFYFFILVASTTSFSADEDCTYVDMSGKSSKLDSSKVPDGASVESKSVNLLPGDLKQKLYDGSMTKCVTCEKNYIKCSSNK
jgi:hypothetical protein